MKKAHQRLILLAILGLLTTSCWASFLCFKPYVFFSPCIPYLGGTYIGAGIGLDHFNVHENININYLGTTLTGKKNWILTGPVAKLTLGYSQFFNWFYLGGEVFADFDTANTDGFFLYQTKLRSLRTYGAGILPGIRLNYCSFVYARVGAVKTYQKFDEIGVLNKSFDTLDGNGGASLGLGFETFILPHISWRIEYSYTNYGTTTSVIDTKFQSKNKQVMTGLFYHFC